MKPEAQRIAIAEACGWNRHPYNPSYGSATGRGAVLWPSGLPDYLTDLNAMHEAEKVLTDKQHDEFQGKLIWVVEIATDSNKRLRYISATAAQRAEAFLRTLGKWEESS